MSSGRRYIGSVSAFLILFAAMIQNGHTQSFLFKGQAIGWTVASQMEEPVGIPGSGDTRKVWRGQAGIRYLPEIQLQAPIKEDFSFDAELSANIWVWGLIGNDKRKGWEVIPSVKNKPEFGFRVQLPIPGGELATTYHYRVADAEKVFPIPHGEKPHIREKRLALDGKFDYVIGFWFEAALTHQEIHIPELKYSHALSLGLDYTFGLGNGLNLMTEYFTFGSSEKPLSSVESVHFSALSANYSFNIINNLNGILFYDWTNKDFYNFINWSWQYDKWSFYIMGFWNPQRFNLYQGLQGTNLYAGRGLQFMVVFNH